MDIPLIEPLFKKKDHMIKTNYQSKSLACYHVFDILFKLFIMVVSILILFYAIKFQSKATTLLENGNNFISVKLPNEIKIINHKLDEFYNITNDAIQNMEKTNNKIDILLCMLMTFEIIPNLNVLIENLSSFNVTQFMNDINTITYDLNKIIHHNKESIQ